MKPPHKVLIAIGVTVLLAGLFILTAPWLHHSQKPETIELAVAYDGTILWNGKRVTCQEVSARFAARSPEVGAMMRAHPLDCKNLPHSPQP